MYSRGERLVRLAKKMKHENSGSETESDSNSNSIFGDNSSDLYSPDVEELSDSDREVFTEQKTNSSLVDDIVIGPSDDDDDVNPNEPRSSNVSHSQQQVRELQIENNNSNFNSDDDIIGPSDEDETRIGQVNFLRQGLRGEQPLLQSKKKKHFSLKIKVSRKRNRNHDAWVKNKAAIARSKGETYNNYKGHIKPAKVVEKEILCSEKCRLKCSNNFSINQRQDIFNQFYKLDVNAKNALLFGLIQKCPVKRTRKGAMKHKSASFKYHITHGGEHTYVCKNAFAKLFDIGKKKIDLLQKTMKEGASAPEPDKRGKHNSRPHKLKDEVKEYIKQHISQFPAEESHYSRTTNIHKKYLSPLLNITKMYQLYIEKCREDNVDQKMFHVKECTYRNVFVSEFNLSFGHPKSDTCSKCDAGESNEEHVKNYQAGYRLLKSDREKAKISDNMAYLTIDLQQTMPLPRLSTSKAFYLRQLWLYNFGIHILTKEVDKAVFCSWTEDQASRGSSEIFSCLLTVLEMEESLHNKDHLIIWSDSCAGQNKNFLLICLYQYLIHKGLFKVIEHKFPEVGHTYLDSDRDFGRIEKNLRKHQNIYSPEQYREIIVKSCKKNKVIDMTLHFRETKNLEQNLKLYNRKKDVDKKKVHFRDNIKWLRVEEYGSYHFKTSFDENAPFQKVNIYQKLSGTPALGTPITIPRLVQKTGSIKQPKVENLRQQMVFIPDQHKWWYEQILHEYP